ncbi:L,D-transpeptidase [Ancylobacter polymorphus]|jgi:lipoprotein-anchoring transpeptidase ErfK/SrfK|uniref:L,D-transpeptidase n=1 Tax=Ancylobacter polymorphus TaxID=223390 RepID=A0A9E6ZRU8_9HYPH|nr:L,D-transpeptidase [Ancylobacter polymorphus]MDQ0304205.1 lipoprotein-anchoring transpeptidase ErfK/SrfK [Ancylobacter polymorphus]UOK69346.1 L,D-transpeptidase [Ancylobacter polymorphus]
MVLRGAAVVLLAVLLAACSNAQRQPAPEASLTPRDKKLLADAPYKKVQPPEMYQRAIVDYAGTEKPGTIVVDTDKKFLYLVEDNGKAIRYGVTVGEEGLAFKGEAKVGRKAEWPTWTPTPEIKQRLAGIPNFVGPGPHNPMGARALYLYQGNKDTLFRIHGTNQPEYIGWAISSGCIRMLNEDVIDLYTRVPQGANVVVL